MPFFCIQNLDTMLNVFLKFQNNSCHPRAARVVALYLKKCHFLALFVRICYMYLFATAGHPCSNFITYMANAVQKVLAVLNSIPVGERVM